MYILLYVYYWVVKLSQSDNVLPILTHVTALELKLILVPKTPTPLPTHILLSFTAIVTISTPILTLYSFIELSNNLLSAMEVAV